MPRPDLDALNVSYRRIPVLAVGKDVYCDTRLIIKKLETLFPNGALGATDPEQRTLQKLLERWTGDAGLFTTAVALIPTNLPNMKVSSL
jgi:glutathione S-transferase